MKHEIHFSKKDCTCPKKVQGPLRRASARAARHAAGLELTVSSNDRHAAEALKPADVARKGASVPTGLPLASVARRTTEPPETPSPEKKAQTARPCCPGLAHSRPRPCVLLPFPAWTGLQVVPWTTRGAAHGPSASPVRTRGVHFNKRLFFLFKVHFITGASLMRSGERGHFCPPLHVLENQASQDGDGRALSWPRALVSTGLRVAARPTHPGSGPGCRSCR